MATVDGKKVAVGDWVSFKSDYEQSGRVERIEGENLHLFRESGFGGEYLRYEQRTVVRARDCWLEEG